jgi:ABC-type lipoprotein export system ATPase subunit
MTGEMGAMISLRHVSKTYSVGKQPSVPAVRDANLEVQRGEFIVITGRSGSGKTTLLNLISALARPSAGQVLIDGLDLWTLRDRQQSLLRNRRFGFIFQFPSLLPSLTSMENAMLPAMFSAPNPRMDEAERAEELLRQVGLEAKLGAYPRQLSAGQQKRVVIARALMNQPDILIADEATGDLDEQTEIEVMQLIRRIHETTDVTVLMVTHNAELVRYGTRSLQMASGSIVGGDIHEIRPDPPWSGATQYPRKRFPQHRCGPVCIAGGGRRSGHKCHPAWYRREPAYWHCPPGRRLADRAAGQRGAQRRSSAVRSAGCRLDARRESCTRGLAAGSGSSVSAVLRGVRSQSVLLRRAGAGRHGV